MEIIVTPDAMKKEHKRPPYTEYEVINGLVLSDLIDSKEINDEVTKYAYVGWIRNEPVEMMMKVIGDDYAFIYHCMPVAKRNGKEWIISW